MPGFAKGRKLDKIGLKVQDTAELSFSDVRVPVANLLGEEGEAFCYLGHNLPQERLTIAVGVGRAGPRRGHGRHRVREGPLVFGTDLSHLPEHQVRARRLLSPRSRPARRCWTGRSRLLSRASSPAADAAMVKLFCTEMQARVVDRCLQFFGGYGYMHGVPDRPAVHRRPGHAHLRRHQRGHEADHQQVARLISTGEN